MESFWERIFDTLVLLAKAIAVFLVIRVVLMIFDVPLSVPYLDNIFFSIIDMFQSITAPAGI